MHHLGVQNTEGLRLIAENGARVTTDSIPKATKPIELPGSDAGGKRLQQRTRGSEKVLNLPNQAADPLVANAVQRSEMQMRPAARRLKCIAAVLNSRADPRIRRIRLTELQNASSFTDRARIVLSIAGMPYRIDAARSPYASGPDGGGPAALIKLGKNLRHRPRLPNDPIFNNN